MTKEEAKKIIKSRCYFASVLPDTKEALDMATEALSAEPQEWISVKDGLPEKSDIYWVTVTDTRFERNLVHAFAYDINSKRWANGHLLNSERVIAWMKREVPSPYKGDEE